MGYGGYQPLSSNHFLLFDFSHLAETTVEPPRTHVTSRQGPTFCRKQLKFGHFAGVPQGGVMGGAHPPVRQLVWLVVEALWLDHESAVGERLVARTCGTRLSIDREPDDHGLVEAL